MHVSTITMDENRARWRPAISLSAAGVRARTRAPPRAHSGGVHICSTAPVKDVSRYSLYMLCVPLRELYLIVTP